MVLRPAVFFDRDGVLNVDGKYLYRREDIRWIPGAADAVRRANQLGFATVVVTNQSGIARGFFSEHDVGELHAWMQQQLQSAGAHIDRFYYCPHLPESADPLYAVHCDCRKPAPGMLLRAAEELGLDLRGSVLIGDSRRDVEAAEAAGVAGHLYQGGNMREFLDAALVDRLRSPRAICVGDVMLDHFVYGEVSRISPEAPVPVLHVQRQQSMLGGAGNAVRNLSALGCAVTLLSVAGDDESGRELSSLCGEMQGCVAQLLTDPGRVTASKTRFVAHGQQLLRADRETSNPLSETLLGSLLERFEQMLPSADAVLLSDYAKGVLSGAHAGAFIAAAQRHRVPVIVDPKGTAFTRYSGATVIKPNLRELAIAVDMPVDSSAAIEEAARRLIERTGVPFVLVTRGPDGMTLVHQPDPPIHFRALAREVYDVTGAGDTVAAVLTAAFGAHLPVRAAVEFANIAAGIVVGKTGTATVSRDEITLHLQRPEPRQEAESSVRDGR